MLSAVGIRQIRRGILTVQELAMGGLGIVSVTTEFTGAERSQRGRERWSCSDQRVQVEHVFRSHPFTHGISVSVQYECAAH
jgi:hypothetical protein